MASNVINRNPSLNRWHGENVLKLTQDWGRPSRISTALNGNWQYIYVKMSPSVIAPQTTRTETFMTPRGTAVGVNVPSNSPGFTTGLECSTIFEVNPRNIILSVRQEGPGC